MVKVRIDINPNGLALKNQEEVEEIRPIRN